MSTNFTMQPVGCATHSFVLEPLVGLTAPGPITPTQPLWREYWSKGELCVLTGDTGAGKTLLALQLGKEMTSALNTNVLYIGHEYDKQGFAARFGPVDNDVAGRFFFAVFNRSQTGVHKTYNAFKEWLVEGLQGLLKATRAQVLIFDQPDRLNLSNLQWIEFLNVIEELRAEHNLSVLLVVNSRNRNTGKPVELYHAYKHQYTTPFADSVVAVARCHTNMDTRYLKLLKCKNRPMPGFNDVNVFHILTTDDNYLSILSQDEEQPEYRMLPKTATMLRMDKQFMAESFRKDGLGYARIATLLDVPESTVRGWVSRINVADRFSPPKEGEYSLLPENLKNGYKPIKSSFKEELPEEVLEGNEEVKSSLPPSGYSLQSETKTELRKHPNELHTVVDHEVEKTPLTIGGFTINLVQAKAG
jgi:hypothetical protein